jgi:hypothetical protein
MGLKKQRRPVLPNLHGKISKNDVYRLRPEKFDEKVMGNRLGNTWKSGMNSFFPRNNWTGKAKVHNPFTSW